MSDSVDSDNIEQNDMKNKYIATFMLHALGDTIGFKNGDWEFNYNKDSTLDTITEYVFEFIDLGGVNGIDLKDWRISDDTILHIAIANAILEYEGKIDDRFVEILKNCMIAAYNRMQGDRYKKGINRFMGKITEKYIGKFTEEKDGRFYPYDPTTGGNGCAMRNLCIGLAFHKVERLNTLIDISITSSRMTHNSAIGYLAGFTSALFVSFAIQNISINRWVKLLIDLLESEKIKKYVNKNNNDEFMDYVSYIRFWKKYAETRFVDEKPIKTRASTNMIFRIRYYYNNFFKNTNADFLGGSGYCAMIMAYDALLDCDGKWEKLIFYAMLHPGDTDTIGAIAGGLFGAIYGFADVPQQMICCIEDKDVLLKLGKQYFEKYYL